MNLNFPVGHASIKIHSDIPFSLDNSRIWAFGYDGNIEFNDGNIIIDDKYLDLNIRNYSYSDISNIFRIKFNNLDAEKIYIISNDNMSYYYDNQSKKFVFTIGNQVVSSKEYNIEQNN